MSAVLVHLWSEKLGMTPTGRVYLAWWIGVSRGPGPTFKFNQ